MCLDSTLCSKKLDELGQGIVDGFSEEPQLCSMLVAKASHHSSLNSQKQQASFLQSNTSPTRVNDQTSSGILFRHTARHL